MWILSDLCVDMHSAAPGVVDLDSMNVVAVGGSLAMELLECFQECGHI